MIVNEWKLKASSSSLSRCVINEIFYQVALPFSWTLNSLGTTMVNFSPFKNHHLFSFILPAGETNSCLFFQVLLPISGSHPLLWHICTCCEGEEFDFPKVVPQCIYKVILASWFNFFLIVRDQVRLFLTVNLRMCVHTINQREDDYYQFQPFNYSSCPWFRDCGL